MSLRAWLPMCMLHVWTRLFACFFVKYVVLNLTYFGRGTTLAGQPLETFTKMASYTLSHSGSGSKTWATCLGGDRTSYNPVGRDSPIVLTSEELFATWFDTLEDGECASVNLAEPWAESYCANAEYKAVTCKGIVSIELRCPYNTMVSIVTSPDVGETTSLVYNGDPVDDVLSNRKHFSLVTVHCKTSFFRAECVAPGVATMRPTGGDCTCPDNRQVTCTCGGKGIFSGCQNGRRLLSDSKVPENLYHDVASVDDIPEMLRIPFFGSDQTGVTTSVPKAFASPLASILVLGAFALLIISCLFRKKAQAIARTK